ncbi:MAG: caspase family protein [Rhizobiaceae bacterium]
MIYARDNFRAILLSQEGQSWGIGGAGPMGSIVREFSFKFMLGVVLGTILLVFSNSFAFAGARVALVIGNSNYTNASSLPNPVNDADDLAQKLEGMGFEVLKLKNLGFQAMRLALRDFSAKAAGADVALIFYAGHGMEVNKHNYLVPVDAVLASDRDINYEAVPLQMLTDAASGAKGLSLVLLDACRNNPFVTTMKRSLGSRAVGRGLAAVEPARGTLVSFAAKEGSVASDGVGRNSPYTKSLLKNLSQPGVDIQFMFRKVRDDVLESTNGGQEPFTYGSLPGRQIFLIEPEVIASTQEPVQPADTQTALNVDEAARVYKQITGTKNIAVLNVFIQQFPDSIYSKFIQAEIESIKSSKSQGLIGKAPAPMIKLPKKQQRVAVLKLNKPGLRSASPMMVACDRLAANKSDTDNRTDHSTKFAALEKRSSEAIRACKTAHKNFPKDDQTSYQLARSFHAAKKYDSAQEFYLLAAQSNYGAALYGYGEMFNKGLGVKTDTVKALKYFNLAAKNGSGGAMNRIGNYYAIGEALLKKDYVKAAYYYTEAAKEGSARGMLNLGYYYEVGRGVKKDIFEAAQYYKNAADLGDVTAMTNLAFLYEGRKGIPTNYSEAVRYYQLASGEGDKRAQTNLGYLYETGKGVPKNVMQAVVYYRLAADRGYIRAMTNLGYLYEGGHGIDENPEESTRYYKAAIEKGSARAMLNLGYNFEVGRGVKKDASEAARLYKMGADKGNKSAMTNYAFLSEGGRGIPKNLTASVRNYNLAIQKGSPRAMDNLAHLYAKGKGVPKSLSKAFKLFKQAAEKNYARAMYSTARYYNGGLGVKKNSKKAAEWYYQSLKRKYAFAIKELRTNSTAWSKNFRLELQRKLKAGGYYFGTIDGKIGAGTMSAVARM